MGTIGIRELKTKTSATLRRAQRGETVVVTDRGKPIVQITPVAVGASEDDRVLAAVRAGRLAWSGGKPRGLERPPRFKRSVAGAVLQDRR